MKVILEIEVGNEKSSVEFTGELSKEKTKKRIANFIEAFEFPTESSTSLSSGAPFSKKDINDLSVSDFEEWTIKKRLKYFLFYEFHQNWFTSKEIKKEYQSKYNEEIGLSTVSTYLSRMEKEGFLKKRGNRVEREYRLSEEARERGLDEIENKAKI